VRWHLSNPTPKVKGARERLEFQPVPPPPPPFPTHRYRFLEMAVGLAKNVFLALLLTLITTAYATCCEKPRIRREWRSISEAERRRWVDAVKVGSSDLKQRAWTLVVADSGVVSQKGAPQGGIDPDLQHLGHQNSTRQHQQLLLRRYTGSPPPKHFTHYSPPDFVYTHMDLNPLVGVSRLRVDSLRPSRDLDPFHWSLLALAPNLHQRFRDRVTDRMQLSGSSPILGLDVGSVGSSATPPVLHHTDVPLPRRCQP